MRGQFNLIMFSVVAVALVYNHQLNLFYGFDQQEQLLPMFDSLYNNDFQGLSQTIKPTENDLAMTIATAKYYQQLAEVIEHCGLMLAEIGVNYYSSLLLKVQNDFPISGIEYLREYLARSYFILNQFNEVVTTLTVQTQHQRPDFAAVYLSGAYELLGKPEEARTALAAVSEYSDAAVQEAQYLAMSYGVTALAKPKPSGNQKAAPNPKVAVQAAVANPSQPISLSLLNDLRLLEPEVIVNYTIAAESGTATELTREYHDPAKFLTAAEVYRSLAAAAYERALEEVYRSLATAAYERALEAEPKPSVEVAAGIRHNLALLYSTLGWQDKLTNLEPRLDDVRKPLYRAVLAARHFSSGQASDLLTSIPQGNPQEQLLIGRIWTRLNQPAKALEVGNTLMTQLNQPCADEDWTRDRLKQQVASMMSHALLSLGRGREANKLLTPHLVKAGSSVLTQNDLTFFMSLCRSQFASGPRWYPEIMSMLMELYKHVPDCKPVISQFRIVYAGGIAAGSGHPPTN